MVPRVPPGGRRGLIIADGENRSGRGGSGAKSGTAGAARHFRNVLALEAVVKNEPRNQIVKSVDDLPNPNGPGSVPVSKEAHKMVQKEKGLDPHRRTGDRNTDLMGRK
jgi:hypothetical protein